MNIGNSLSFVKGAVMFVIAFLALCSPLSAGGAESSADPAVASLKKSCPSCEVLSSESTQLPYSDRELIVLHVYDQSSYVVRQVSYLPNGVEVPFEDSVRAEAATRRATVGALSETMVDQCLASPNDREIEVYLMGAADVPGQDRERIAKDELYAAQYEADVKTAIEKAQSDLVDALADLGYLADTFLDDAPMVHAVVLSSDLAKLARDDRVLAIDPDEGVGVPTSDTWSDRWMYATDLDMVADWGWRGNGQKIGIILHEQPTAYDYSNFLDVTATANPAGTTLAQASWTVGFARSKPAGMLSDTPDKYAGSASSSTTYMANLDGYVGSVENWAYGQGCRVFAYARASSSASTTALSAHDRYVDYFTRTRPCTNGCVHYVASAGNRTYLQGPWSDCQASSYYYVQNRFFNGLIVGGTALGERQAWGGDEQMYQCSAWRNISSSEGEREIPHVAAPASQTTTGVNGTNGEYRDGLMAGGQYYSGTSASASMVSGLIADMLQRAAAESSDLAMWPEAVRSIIMATAWHDADGNVFSTTQRIDDRDGAGLISASHAVQLSAAANRNPANGSRRGWYPDTAYPSEFSGGWYTSRRNYVAVDPNNTLQATLSWTAHGTCTDPNNPATCSEPALDANLDLVLRKPDLTVAASSTTLANNYEFLRYTNTTGAVQYFWLDIALVGSFAASETYLGLAWDQMDEGGFYYADTCDTTTQVESEADSAATYNFISGATVAALKSGEYVGAWTKDSDATWPNGRVKMQVFGKDANIKFDDVRDLGYRTINPRISAIDSDRFVIGYNSKPSDSTFEKASFGVYDRTLHRYGTFDYDIGTGTAKPEPLHPDVGGYSFSDATGQHFGYWTSSVVTYASGSVRVQVDHCQMENTPFDCTSANAGTLTTFTWERADSTIATFPTGSLAGGSIVAWADPDTRGIKLRCYRPNDANGAPDPVSDALDISNPPLPPSAQYEAHPGIVVFPDGRFVVAWVDRESKNVEYRLFTSDCTVETTIRSACTTTSGDLNCTEDASRVSDDTGRISVVSSNQIGKLSEFRIGYPDRTARPSFRTIRPYGSTQVVDAQLGTGFVAMTGMEQRRGQCVGVAHLPDCGYDWISLWGTALESNVSFARYRLRPW
jgi:hypothetical protein